MSETSNPLAVKDYLEQFEGDEKIGAALQIASELGAVIKTEYGEDETATFYATEVAAPDSLKELAANVDGLRWIAGVAGVAEHLCQPITEEN